MNILTIDFETRCAVSIQDAGPWKYAANPTCTPICCAAMWNDEEPKIWINDWVIDALDVLNLPVDFIRKTISREELLDMTRKADIIEAHNAEFERAIWAYHMPGELPLEKVHCTAARAAMAALPRDLRRVCQVLKLEQQKDDEGGKLMKQVSLPKRSKDGAIEWDNDPAKLRRTCEYCMQDVRAEHAASLVLPRLPPLERKIWLLDQTINERGVYIDVAGARAMVNMVETYKATLFEEFRKITGGNPEKPTQVAQLLKWVEAHGISLDNMQAEHVDQVITTLEDGPVKRALQIRRAAGKSSNAKYIAMLERAENDQRARSLFMYHGAGTGRWAGNSVQPQNLPSRKVFKQPEVALEAVTGGASPEFIWMTCGDPMWVASSCIRSVITAGPEQDLYVGDYRSIEGRVLAWLADEQYVLEAYWGGADLYKIAASNIYHKAPEEIADGSPERQVGKVCELALGFQGGSGALERMADSYGVKLPSPEEVTEIIRAWRKSRPQTVRLWKEVENAAMMAVKNPGQMVQCGRLVFRVLKGALMMRLPSGRCLFYQAPSIGLKKAPWLTEDGTAAKVPSLLFWGIDSETKQWCQQSTYGGCLVENAVQAISRDLLCHGMLTVEASGRFRMVLHVHDEGVAEGDPGQDINEYLSLLTTKPEWARNIPVVAEGWTGKRYKKG